MSAWGVLIPFATEEDAKAVQAELTEETGYDIWVVPIGLEA